MVRQKKRKRETTDTEPALVKALRQENEELREENEGLKLRNAKLEAGCQTLQEEEKEVKLPTEVWAIIAKKVNKNDVCSFALVSKQLREAQVLAGRELVTRPVRRKKSGSFVVKFFTEGWCAYWSRKFYVHHTDPEVIKRVLDVAAYHGYLQVFEKYWSQVPQKRLSKLWDKETCVFAAFRGRLEVLQWMRAQDPPCPWNSGICYTLLVKVTWTSCAGQGGKAVLGVKDWSVLLPRVVTSRS